MPSRAVAKRQVSEITAAEKAEVSRQLLKGEEEERRRISRELHDETGQALMVLRFHLEMLAGDAPTKEQQTKVRESLDLLDGTIEGLRRIIARLSPRVLEELGLLTAIRRQAEQVGGQVKMRARLNLPEKLAPMDHEIEVALYRSVQEALHNVAKHSQASTFTVRVQSAGEKVILEIEDDGVGLLTRSPHERGFGLTGMRERAAALSGTMMVHSRRGKGTHIRIVLPCTSSESSQHEAGSTARHVRRISAARAS
ncbi:MAG TPA: sensor histidine kinase [Terriglobales bacterium]|nr:sensor histidine kinase [Terriglobales bacterium]